MKPVRDLLKHSSVYAVGQILTRMASILLLPLYTHCLTPADYGITAILDLTTAIIALVIGGGMVTAVTRFHFDDDSEKHTDRVWWTGLVYVAVLSSVILVPLWWGRQLLSDLTLGSNIAEGPKFFSLTLMTIWASVLGHVCDAYLRVKKWSGLFVAISMARLLLNVGLNVTFLVGMNMGVYGLLLGNLIATIVHTTALLIVFASTRGWICFDRMMARQLVKFSIPLVATAVLSMMMHEADRYILQRYVSLGDVGIYSLAHRIGFAVNTLCLMPFISIWHVAIYDIERMGQSDQVFGRVFRWFVSGFGVLLLGASLIVKPLLPILTPDAYGGSADLVSLILLGFFFFGLQFQFEVPALLTKRSGLLVPGNILGVIVNIGGNLLLIPEAGVSGAAWVGVATYFVCSFCILAVCRQSFRIQYPWLSCSLIFAGLCTTFVVVDELVFPRIGSAAEVVVTIAVCALWALVLFGRDGLIWWASKRSVHSDVSPDAEPSDTAGQVVCDVHS